MAQNKNIDYLLDRFRKKTITGEELNLLRAYFYSEYPGDDINAYFDKLWNEKNFIGEHIDLERNFREIQSKLNIDSKDNHVKVSKYRKLGIKALSYAAIFILGIGLFFLVDFKKSASSTVEEFVTITIPYGSKSEIELPDGSIVTLNSGSYLKYPTAFGLNTRNIEFEGEAFFDISRNEKVPFVVNTSDIHIKVLGTTFNVKSYPEDEIIETTLVTGTIEIFHKRNEKQQSKHIYLKPNEKISIPKHSHTSVTKTGITNSDSKKIIETTPKIILEKGINTAYYTAWKNNKLVFDNEKFSEIMIKMERWYDITIEIHFLEISDERFSGKFEKETLQQSMEALSLIAPIRYTIEKNKVEIFKRPK